MTTRAARQKFEIGYHLNSWDLTGQPLEPAIRFLSEQGFRWFEILSGASLSTQFSRRVMQLGPKPPLGVITDTDILRRMGLLSRAQHDHGIRLSAFYISVEYLNDVAWPYEIGVLEGLLRLTKGFGAPVLCLGGGRPDTPWAPHTTQEVTTFCRRLEEIGKRAADMGITAVYHPHLDNFIEGSLQLDRVMNELDTRHAGLCIDPAHIVHVGSDPVAITRQYASAIRYMHLKDTRVSPELKGAARYGAFSELGAGVVDLPGLVDVLLDTGYDGIAIIELDASQKTAEQSTLESIDYIVNTLGLTLSPAPVA